MATETSPNCHSHEEDLPPGTFLLVRHESNEDHTQSQDTVMLDPVPSNDPNQPLNWSMRRKAVNYTLVMAVSCLIFTSITIQQNFWQLMVVDLNVTYKQLANSNSVNYVGLSCGCIMFIPFSRKFGRRPIYLISTVLMLATALWSARMKSMWEVYVTNLIQGLAGATNETLAQMTIGDLFFVHHRATANGLYVTTVMIGSFLIPVLAGVQATHQGWRWSYWTLSAVNGVLVLLFFFFYEETKFSTEVIEGLQTPTQVPTERPLDKKCDVASGECEVQADDGTKQNKHASASHPSATNHEFDYSIPMNSWKKRLALITPSSEPIWPYFYRPFQTAIYFPTVLFVGIQYAALIVWLAIIANVIALVFPLPPYNFNPQQVGYMSFGPFVGNLLGSIYGGLLGDWTILFFSRRNKGYYEPEMRLYTLHIPAIFLCGGIIMFGTTVAQGMHWILPSIGGALFGFGLGSIGDAALTLVLDSYPEIVSDAMTIIAFMRNAISIGIPFALVPWMGKGVSNMFIECGCMSLAFSGLIIPMIIYGREARRRTAPKYMAMAARLKGLH
ncbi:MFS transporter, putative [Talaromyces stipitatus ATCC 10500]|uniref:MFS transporter, putative n=1 Tax=Talaromyces stipitatus (strain ATCC 10500 / CBS 375.48 / QM 6759 / NRRL 1006) TaxID=441959 RepID=B8MP08_TALSN|nr:MFS transporter, putative [Talaromyces stipitatus ATCC 10500]EED14247.1 MFS transporter, putative [Talaromyces stipitatus ATCC 10500]